MALKATIYKAQLAIADMDRGVYADHNVTIARHPSEADERMMIRLLAFALNVTADDNKASWSSPRTSGMSMRRPCGTRTTPTRSCTGSTSASPTTSA